MIIPMMYYFFDRCKGHPMNLIAIICLFEMISNWNFFLIGLDIYQVEEVINLNKIFHALTFDILNFTPGKRKFCAFNDGFFVIVETLIVSFNMFFSLDLYITLRKPFYEGKKRQKLYNILAVAITAVLFGLMFNDLDSECGDIENNFGKYVFPYSNQ